MASALACCIAAALPADGILQQPHQQIAGRHEHRVAHEVLVLVHLLPAARQECEVTLRRPAAGKV